MQSSIVSYPTRGSWGKSNWRGNTSGHLIKDMMEFLQPRIVADPACGSNTTGDVCADMKNQGAEIQYVGLDLHSGFNLLRDSLADRVAAETNGKLCDWIFFHPPYASVIEYSGNVWGAQPHADDLSRCQSYEDFLAKMSLAMNNIYDAVRAGGDFSILIGDLRRDGKYTSIQADLIQLAPGNLNNIVIKAQHNMKSLATRYSGRFLPITHEYLLSFRKEAAFFGMIDTTLKVSRRLETLSRANWKAAIYQALNRLGGSGSLPEIYSVIEETAKDKTLARPNWQARVRAELQKNFRNLERGVWAFQN